MMLKAPVLVNHSDLERWVGLFAAIITELTRRIEGGNANAPALKPESDEEERWRRFVGPKREK